MRYTPKRKPYNHQVAGLRHLLSTGYGGALLMDPRTGKTQTTLDYMSVLHLAGREDPSKTKNTLLTRILIVCPMSVLGVWEDEISAVIPDHIPRNVLVWDRFVRRAQQDKSQNAPALPNEAGALNIVITNYDAFSAPGEVTGFDEFGNPVRSRRKGGRYSAAISLRKWQPQMIVLDESHRIKTPSARKTMILQSLGRFDSVKWRVVMTGTSVTKKNRVFDIYSQWKFLNPEGWISQFNAADFKDKFGVWHKRNTRTGGNYMHMARLRNVKLLHSLIHQDAFAVTREECFDLPPQRSTVSHVEMDPEEARVYDEMSKDLVAKIQSGEITEAQIKLVQVLRLAQITSGIAKTSPSPEYPEGRVVRIGRSKLKHLEDRLEDLCKQNDEKVVVVARFKADISGIVVLAKKMRIPVHELHGSIKRADRDRAIREFRTLDGPRVFVMQPQVGSLGIDLSTAGTMIWFSLTNSYVDWDQCNQRTALNPRGTVVEYLLSSGTVDEVMLASLLEDQDVARMIHKSPQYLLRGFKKPTLDL